MVRTKRGYVRTRCRIIVYVNKRMSVVSYAFGELRTPQASIQKSGRSQSKSKHTGVGQASTYSHTSNSIVRRALNDIRARRLIDLRTDQRGRPKAPTTPPKKHSQNGPHSTHTTSSCPCCCTQTRPTHADQRGNNRSRMVGEHSSMLFVTGGTKHSFNKN